MQSKNPVLSKPDAWLVPSQQQAYGQQGAPYQEGYAGQAYPPPGQPYGDPNASFQPGVPIARMTIEDVVTKSAVTLGVVAVAAVLTFMFMPLSLLMPVWIVSGLVSFGVALFASFRHKVNPGFVLLYAAVEGVFLGAISKAYEYLWSGIVPAALMSTLFAAAATLLAYRLFNIRVNNKFRKFVMIGTLAYAGLLLVNVILSFFGAGFLFNGGNLVLMLAVSALGIGLAVFNLILDFDYIEQGIAMGAEASESWRAAFGLTVTLVWLYVEMLRLLSYFRN